MKVIVAKLCFWLIVVWGVCLCQGRIDRGPTLTIFDLLALASLPFVAIRVSREHDAPITVLVFGCLGAFPFFMLILEKWERYSAYSNDSTLGAILFQVCGPVVGMGLFCRALAVHWPGLRDPTNNGLCKVCGYNLTGNVSGICPECGTVIPRGEIQRDRGSPNR